MFNQNWIQIQGKEEVPADIKMRQAAQFVHVIPYWQQYGQQLQLIRAADDASQPKPQLAIPDGSPRSQTPLYTSPPIGAPEVRGPDGFAMQVVAASARSEPATTESYVIATPRTSPQQPHIGRSMLSLPWRSTSCSRRAPTKRDGSCMSTPGATDVAASTAPLHRFTFGGLEPRPAPDLPPPPMDVVKGFVVDNPDKDRDAASRRDAILDARDESLRNERELLRMEREKMQREQAAFLSEKNEREEGRLRRIIATTEAQLQERAKSETVLRAELQTSWNQMQQRESQDQRRASVTAQTRRTLELQERKIDDLKDMMSNFTADVKATFAEIAHAQKGHELGFNVVRAELRDLKGGMSQVVTKTQELESAMDDWAEQEGLETWDEEQDDAMGWTPQQAKQVGDMLIQRQQDEGAMYDDDDDGAYGAPDGAAQGN
jgi:hypothetical protein